MNRDFDLVREILLAFEQRNAAGTDAIAPTGYSNEEIKYHVDILVDAGFIKSIPFGPIEGEKRATQLTWEGHEFLDSIRDKNQWNAIKEKIKENSVAITFESIKTVASILITKALSS